MARQARRRFMFGGAGVLAVAAVLGVAGLATTGGRAESPPPSPAATDAAPTESPTVAPTRTPIITAPERVEVPMSVPFGPLKAEPYRVLTDDGDCLNVRPVPGTTFKSDPRTCVPVGFLLWLYGEETEVDGYKWRYALGEGWVATQYVVPAPGATTGFGPFEAVTVSNQAGEVTRLAKVTKTGSVTNLPTLPDAVDGLGDVPPALSPDGKSAAYGRELKYVPTLTIRNMDTGAETSYPQVHLASWSATSRLLVRISTNCPQQCTWTTGWIDPRDGVVHELTGKKNDWWNHAWSLDGESLFVIEDGALKQVTLDGQTREIVSKQPEGSQIPWGQLSLSADGKRILSSPYQGAIVIVDIATGAISRVERAKQIPVGGKCGGSVGLLTTWLDEDTVIWHESYAEKGGNGITISDIDGSDRMLIPFFTVSDIRRVAPGLVSFTTWENVDNKNGFQLTWLLDAATGEARPVTVGATPSWE